MSFAFLAYRLAAAAAGAANSDTTAVADPEFSQRNGHYILSERYKLLAASALGVSLTVVRANIPSWNAIVRHHIWPLNRAALTPTYPRIQDLRDEAPDLPVNEEIAWEATNNLACGTEVETVGIWIAPPNWTRNMPVMPDSPPTQMPGGGKLRRFILRATVTMTRVAGVWSAITPLVFAENLRGGWYCVHSCWVMSPASRYFRLVFPRAPLYQGRRLRPGGSCDGAIGNIIDPIAPNYFGTFGYFHAFEPPQMEVLADAAGADACEVRMDCSFYGYQAPPNYAPTGAEVQ